MESEKLTNLVENIYYDVPLYEDNESEEYETLEEIFGLRTAVRGAKRVGNVLRGRGHLNVTVDDAKQYVEQFLRDIRMTRRTEVTRDQFVGWVFRTIIEPQTQAGAGRDAALQNLSNAAQQAINITLNSYNGNITEKQALKILRQFLHVGGARQTAFGTDGLPTIPSPNPPNPQPSSPL